MSELFATRSDEILSDVESSKHDRTVAGHFVILLLEKMEHVNSLSKYAKTSVTASESTLTLKGDTNGANAMFIGQNVIVLLSLFAALSTPLDGYLAFSNPSLCC
uniref:Transmembrane protein n=1 Tax=Heterorhabditis bacteriophora TaxID=37862 RepID=A0A1I7X962_HETBA